MTATLVKLAFAGIRSRLLASALTIVISSVAAATIVLALEVGQTARDPWQRTFDAANGAHVLANVPSQADARAIATLPGVAERDEPTPIALASLASGGGTDRVLLAGLRSPARVNAPVRTEGAAPPADGIVLERSFADALGLRVGTALRLAAAGSPIELPIVGTAISPSQPRYPRVGARATAQHREIGLLKAVGLTPRQVTAVFAL